MFIVHFSDTLGCAYEKIDSRAVTIYSNYSCCVCGRKCLSFYKIIQHYQSITVFDGVLRSACAKVGCLPSNSKVSKQRPEYHSVCACNIEKESVLWEVTSGGVCE